ncbi:MAG: methyltransferase domain-containing protein [Patescibacteria group bacterium]
MKSKTAKKMLKKVVEDYDNLSKDFDQTRQYSWKEFKGFLPYIRDNDHLIDIGCGNGRFYKFITKNKKISYLGIDNSEKLLEKAREQNPQAKFITGSFLELPVDKNIADDIVAIASLHHVPGKDFRLKAIQELYRILKPNGILIISVWNLFQPRYKKYIWRARLRHILSLGSYDSRDTMIPWGKTGIKRYYYAFTQQELRELLEQNGFKTIKEEIGNNFVFICQKS